MNESMDWDLKEPTSAQLSYAVLISRKLDIEIPPDALQNRFHMALFIDTHCHKLSPATQVPVTSDGARVARHLAHQRRRAKTTRAPSTHEGTPP